MAPMAPMHLAIATGGTGGHIFPALAVAEEIHNRGGAVSIIVAAHRVIQEQYSVEHPEFATYSVNASQVPSNKMQLPIYGARLVRDWRQAQHLLAKINPDVVLGMGSFASVPTCLAAVTRRTPLVLHEGNAVIGKANRLFCRWARHMAISLPLASEHKCRCPISVTGFPVRSSLREAEVIGAGKDCGTARRHFDLEPDRFTVLTFGGSQGAQAINEVMLAVPKLLQAAGLPCQFIHLTGSDQNAAAKAQYANAGFPHWVSGWTDAMADCYRAADLVVSRAGASTISELAMAGKPAVLIPLPSAANDHQTANAKTLADRKAAILLPQQEATPEAIAEIIRSAVNNPDVWTERVQQLRTLAQPHAAEALAELLTSFVQR